MDTGAEVSLIKRKIYDSLKYKPELQRKRLNLMGVDGSPLDIDGVARISFIIGGNSVVQDFYVTRSMSRNVILGRDWLLSNGVRLYFDLKSLRIKNAYVPLEEDVHISSVEKGTNCRLASLQINDTIVPLDDDLCISSLLRTTGKVKIKPLKYVLESPMQNKKIQLWAMCMAGYDCTVEYIAGTENSCADLLSRIDHSLLTDDSDICTETGPDVSDKTYEIGVLDSSNFRPNFRPKDHMDSIIEDVGPEALNDKFQDERTDSSDEDDIPLAELQSRIRQREERLADRLDERSDQIKLDPDDIKTDETVHGDVEPLTDEQLSGDDIKSNSDQDMSIVEVKVKRPKSRSIKAKGLLKALYQYL